MDRTGKEVATVGDHHDGLGPSSSPDVRRVAFYRQSAGNFDVWILEAARGTFTRFTSSPSFELYPIWSPDGSQIVYCSNRTGVYELYRKAAKGGGAEDVGAQRLHNRYILTDVGGLGRRASRRNR